MRLRKLDLLVLVIFSVSLVLQPIMIQKVDFVDSSMKPSKGIVMDISENYEDMDLSTVNMSLILNETEGIVLGNLSIDFHNADTVAFSRIPFHLYLSGMQADTRAGSIVIHNVTTLGSTPTPLLFNVHSSIQLMWVNLTEDLLPGNSIGLKISFTSILPIDSDDRAGVNGDDYDNSKIFEFASAYPIPCVYDEYDGWNTDPYLYIGDPFYFDMAFYNISIQVPKELKLAATGEIQRMIVDGDVATYIYTPLHPVREMTFCASRYYIVESDMFNGVNISVFYLPESAALWEDNALSWSLRAVELFDTSFGEYPYTTLNVVEDIGWYYGMEYPCQVYLSHLIYDRYHGGVISSATLDGVIAHEIAHQWWYHLVGNDEIDMGFLDEGLTCWSVYHYEQYYALGWDAAVYDFENTRRSSMVLINQSIYDNEGVYYFAAYTKAPVVFEKLKQLLGDDDFLGALMFFFNQYSFKIAFLWDLQESFEEYLSEDLDWFFLPMFDNTHLPDYTFSSVVYNQTSNEIHIEIQDLNEVRHNYKYTQQFNLRIENPQGTLEYAVELFGTTVIDLQLPSNVTQAPTRVILGYDQFTLVQQNEYLWSSLYTLDIVIVSVPTTTTTTTTTTTSTSTSTTTTSNTTTGGFETLAPFVMVGGGVGIILILVILYKKKQ
ncbi:MAG: M1 family metallopeptidase [Candidatus Thorarchaeota archaeon]